MRLLRTILTTLLFAIPLLGHAQLGSFQSNCEVGGTKAITQGLNSTNSLQGSWPGCLVTVYGHGTTNLATIYTDGNSTPLANPFTANTTTGNFLFYVLNKTSVDVVIGYNPLQDKLTKGMPTFTYVNVALGGGGGFDYIDVTKFGAVADWTPITGAGTNNHDAVQAAVDYAAAQAAVAGGTNNSQVVYFPSAPLGYCWSTPVRVPANIFLAGASRSSTTVAACNGIGRNNLITVTNQSASLIPSGGISNLTIRGNGSGSTGHLVELVGDVNYKISDVWMRSHGGVCLNVMVSEGVVVENSFIYFCREPYHIAGATSEATFRSVRTLYGQGTDAVGSNPQYSYSINATSGVTPTSGVLFPNATFASGLVDGPQNFHFSDPGTNKSNLITSTPGADDGQKIRIERGGIYINGISCEFGGPSGCLALGGGLKYATTTAEFAPTASSVTVDDVSGQPVSYGSPQDIINNLIFGYTWIAPPDYCGISLIDKNHLTCDPAAHSTIWSSANGILRGTVEIAANFGYTVVDSTFHSAVSGSPNRGLLGTTAIDWPAGAIMADYIGGPGSGEIHADIERSQFHTIDSPDFFGPNYSYQIDNTAQTPLGAPSAEVIAGYVWDYLQIQPAGNNLKATISLDSNTMSNDGANGAVLPATGSILCFDCNISINGALNGSTAQYSFDTPQQVVDTNAYIFGPLGFTAPTAWNGTQACMHINDVVNNRTVDNCQGTQTNQIAPPNPLTGSAASLGLGFATEYSEYALPYNAPKVQPTVSPSGGTIATPFQVRVQYINPSPIPNPGFTYSGTNPIVNITNQGNYSLSPGPQAVIGGASADTVTLAGGSFSVLSGTITVTAGAALPASYVVGALITPYGALNSSSQGVNLSGVTMQIATVSGTTITGPGVNTTLQNRTNTPLTGGSMTKSYCPLWQALPNTTMSGQVTGIVQAIFGGTTAFCTQPPGTNVPLEIYPVDGATFTSQATGTLTVQSSYGKASDPVSVIPTSPNSSFVVPSPAADANGTASFWTLSCGLPGNTYFCQQNIAIGTPSNSITSILTNPKSPAQTFTPVNAVYGVSPPWGVTYSSNLSNSGGSAQMTIWRRNKLTNGATPEVVIGTNGIFFYDANGNLLVGCIQQLSGQPASGSGSACGGGGGGGNIASVAAPPVIYNTTTSTGPNVTFNLNNQAAHTFFAGPVAVLGVPSFRLIDPSDIPTQLFPILSPEINRIFYVAGVTTTGVWQGTLTPSTTSYAPCSVGLYSGLPYITGVQSTIGDIPQAGPTYTAPYSMWIPLYTTTTGYTPHPIDCVWAQMQDDSIASVNANPSDYTKWHQNSLKIDNAVYQTIGLATTPMAANWPVPSFDGEGVGQSYIQQDASVITSKAMVYVADGQGTGITLIGHHFRGVTLDGNHVAPQIFADYGGNIQGRYDDFFCVHQSKSSAINACEIGDPSTPAGMNSTGDDLMVTNVHGIGDGHALSTAATVLVDHIDGSGNPVFNVTAGGSYGQVNPPLYLTGWSAGALPCATMGTVTVTTVSGAIPTGNPSSGIVATGFNCTASVASSMYAVVPDFSAAPYLWAFSNTIDSTFYKVEAFVSRGGILSGSGNTNSLYLMPHPAQNYIGMDINSGAKVVGTDTDSIMFPFVVRGRSSIMETHAYYTAPALTFWKGSCTYMLSPGAGAGTTLGPDFSNSTNPVDWSNVCVSGSNFPANGSQGSNTGPLPNQAAPSVSGTGRYPAGLSIYFQGTITANSVITEGLTLFSQTSSGGTAKLLPPSVPGTPSATAMPATDPPFGGQCWTSGTPAAGVNQTAWTQCVPYPPLMNYLGKGEDGTNTNASGNLVGEWNYVAFNVPFGNTLTVNNNIGLVVRAQTCMIAGKIDATGFSHTGSAGYCGAPSGGSAACSTGNGLAGINSFPSSAESGINYGLGGAAGLTTSLNGANAGNQTGNGRRICSNSGGNTDYSSFGGSNGVQGGCTGSPGGEGGSSVTLICGTFTGTDGTNIGIIDASASPGAPATANNVAPGSGAGGGIVQIASQTPVATLPAIYTAASAGGLFTVPDAIWSSGSCTSPPKATLGVTAGALSSCTPVQVGSGCGLTGAGTRVDILGGGGTGGTVTATWASGALATCSASGGTGYTQSTFTGVGTSGDGAIGWSRTLP